MSGQAPEEEVQNPASRQRWHADPCPAPSELDHWLTGRSRAYSTIAGRLVTAPVQHQPWDLWEATVVELEQSLLTAAGLPDPDDDPLVQFSPGVDVRLGAPRPL
jgi:uncharacterized protein